MKQPYCLLRIAIHSHIQLPGHFAMALVPATVVLTPSGKPRLWEAKYDEKFDHFKDMLWTAMDNSS